MENNFDVSIIMGVKNNLAFSKACYEMIRSLYNTIEICIASNGSTDGTDEWLESIKDENTKIYYDDIEVAYAETWNHAIKLATKKYVIFVHNDMVLDKEFVENLIKHADENTIVGYSTIEPPIFTNVDRPGKYIKSFGETWESLDKESMFEMVEKIKEENKDKTEPGYGTVMSMFPRQLLVDIGGYDPLFNPMFCEDDDLILRCRMLGIKSITSMDSICYHMVSRTSRFSEEYKDKTNEIERHSNLNFVRKWGFRKPKHFRKYNIGFVVKNCNITLLEILEPWCSDIYIDSELPYQEFIDKVQQTTKFNINNKIRFNDEIPTNDIVVNFDIKHFTQNHMFFIVNLSDIITESASLGEFEYDIFTVVINRLNPCEGNLIKRAL